MTLIRRKWDDPRTNFNIAPIFQPNSASRGLAQGTWKTFPDELFIFTDKRVESRPKVAGFDLDSTLIRTMSGNVFPKNNEDWQIWSAEVAKEIRHLHDNGFKICIFTNQRGIHLKKASPSGFKIKIQKICTKLAVPIQVFVSLGSPNYRKPYVGMWELLERTQNEDVPVDRSQSIYVGDAAGRLRTPCRPIPDHSLADRLFAANLGVTFYTPEQFFLKKMEDEEFKMPVFNSSKLLCDKELFDPLDAKFPAAESELVVMAGAPASGKSTLVAQLAEKHNYAIVCQDELKTAVNCERVVAELLKAGRRVIVDNTNRDVEIRKRYVKLAQQVGVVCRCVIMRCGAEQAIHNNLYRKISGLADERHKYINDVVVRMFFSAYKEPTLAEGFTEIIHANFVPEFASEEHKRIFSMYLNEKPEK